MVLSIAHMQYSYLFSILRSSPLNKFADSMTQCQLSNLYKSNFVEIFCSLIIKLPLSFIQKYLHTTIYTFFTTVSFAQNCVPGYSVCDK